MAVEFRTTSVDDLPRIQTLLQSAFGAAANSPNLDPALLRWKYWDGVAGSHSYVLESGGALLAHGALWPVGNSCVPAANLLDWASVKSPPGMGIALVRRLATVTPVLASTGGSTFTRAIMPRIGFKHVGNQNIYVRVLRAWKQHRTRPPESPLRALPRLARNVLWSSGAHAPFRGWTAARVESVADSTANHLLKCPAVKASAWAITHPGERRGYFVLSRVGGQCRIARLRLDSIHDGDWAAAYALAVEAAREDSESCEVVAISSRGLVNEALEANHFHFRDQRPVYIYDPQELMRRGALLPELDMLDDDMAYLNVPEYPYYA